MAGDTEFNSGRFKELILLLAHRSSDDQRMSRVKLNKLLYLADFEAFRQLGHSITGATYIRGDHGPMAAELPLAEEELGRSGYLDWRIEPAGPWDQKVPVAIESPDPSLFTEDELRIVEFALTELAPHGGRAAREWSHEESAGWRIVGKGQAIPYETSIIASEPAPKATIARLRERVLTGIWT
jgi:hypothetical protein